MQNPKANQEVVILIHGLMRSHKSVQRLEWYLSKKGMKSTRIITPQPSILLRDMSNNYTHILKKY